jgi:lysozyme family protein
MRYGVKWPVYARQWKTLVIKASRRAELERNAKKLLANKARYQSIERTSGVPWYMIAVIHLRESDANFSTWLANGDPLSRRTTHVPAGLGPAGSSFEAGALISLRYDGLTTVQDWRLEKQLYHLELYNGAGYDAHGRPSPYLWGGTNIQQPGKYVADGVWDGNAIDSQPGCAPIMALMMLHDASIYPKRED